MKEYNHNNDLNQIIMALEDTVLFVPETPTIKPSMDNFIEYDGMIFNLDGRKDSMTSNESESYEENLPFSGLKREKRIKKAKRSRRKGSGSQASNF